MKFIIVFNLLTITTINPIVNSHENHDHQIYSWSNSKNKTIKTDNNVNSEKLKDIKNKAEPHNIKYLKTLEDNSNS